ncbi:MAG: Gfo/Idh/MocA family oxidoreductase [Flavobacteriaceae bacterium]|nr:Gfo/Idh/MocA family oxidoreductase [Flavobacteriaceae bacterium]
MHGTKGSFIKAKTDVQENDLLAGKLPGTANWGIEPEHERGFLHTEKEGKIVRELVPSLPGNYMDYYDSLYEAIRNDAPVPVTGTEGMRVIKIIEAAILSNAQRKVIDL